MSTKENQCLSCSICYGELTLKNLVMSSCEHTYCNTCFFRWLQTNNTCAMCRKDFLNDDLQRDTLATLSIELVDLHLRSTELMKKNVNLIKETRRLKKDLYEKSQELKKKIMLDTTYEKKIQEKNYNLKKLGIKKTDLLKKIRILKLKKINEKVKKLRLVGKLTY